MIEDRELLSRYAHEKSEKAFAELVGRHLNLVYAAALRRVGGDTQAAEDVTQRVFTALATSAGGLSGRAVLGGWLHTTTRNIAAQLVRTERRRVAREQEAQTMNGLATTDSTAAADWARLRPVIDDALDELGERDREAVILRYFEGRSLADVGARLQLTDNAARMRVDRALERMHGFLARRGVTSTVAALAMALTSQAAVVAPGGLAATVTGAALTGAAAGATGLTVLHFMTNMKIMATAAGIVALAAVGVAIKQSNERDVAQTELAAARHELRDVTARLCLAQDEARTQAAKAATAEKDTDALLAVIDRTKAAAAAAAQAAAGPVTNDMVQSRYRHAQELAGNGNWEAALVEFLWCYDEGMVRVASFAGVRGSFLVSEIARLGAKYPPALAALRERRDRAEQLMLAGTNERGAAMEFAALNAALGETARNLAAYDRLPADDPRRLGLMVRVYDQLIAAKRYTEAAAGRPYDQMVTLFVASTVEHPLPANMPNAEATRRAMRNAAIKSAAKNIEVLAGSGQLDNARAFAEKVLVYDNSVETKAIIQESAARAGHLDLLTVPPTH